MSKPSIAVDLNKFLKLLPQYESNKRVGALQISGIFPNPRGVELHFVNESVIPFQMPNGWIDDQNPHVGGYLVADEDGHLLFLPADVFHAGYSSETDFRSAGFDEDLLERRFWQFDAARKESGDERFTFKGFMRAFAVRCARGVTKHTVGDVDAASVNASVSISNPADAPRFVWSSQAALDVVAERRRQIEVEGFDLLHDQQYVRGELLDGAVCYMSQIDKAPPLWPFPLSAWKPKDKRSNLVRAAALLVAEIERMDFQSHSVDAVMALSDASPPVVMDGIIPASPPVSIWDTLKDLGRPITCEIKIRDDDVGSSMNGTIVYLTCEGEKFSWDSPNGWVEEYYLRPIGDNTALAFTQFGLVDANQKPCISSGDVVVVDELLTDFVDHESFSKLASPVLPAQIVCYSAQDLHSRSSALTALGNVNLGDQQNLAILYSECLGIAAAENMDFLQLIYFLDVGVRALFRVKQIQDCWASSLNA